MLGKHLWADKNAPLTTTTYSTQDSEELVALPACATHPSRSVPMRHCPLGPGCIAHPLVRSWVIQGPGAMGGRGRPLHSQAVMVDWVFFFFFFFSGCA